jgi:hypothetical protein
MKLSRLFLGLLTLALFACLVSPVFAAETKGKIKRIDADKNEFVLTDKDNKDHTFQLEEKVKVFTNNKEVRFADLRIGDEVTITYQERNGRMMVSEIRCTRSNE